MKDLDVCVQHQGEDTDCRICILIIMIKAQSDWDRLPGIDTPSPRFQFAPGLSAGGRVEQVFGDAGVLQLQFDGLPHRGQVHRPLGPTEAPARGHLHHAAGAHWYDFTYIEPNLSPSYILIHIE